MTHVRALVAALLTLAVLALSACGGDDETTTTQGGADSGGTRTATQADACPPDALALKNPGQLAVGRDKPAFPPYFVDDDPSNGKGFESAVAYAIADELGVAKDDVKWAVVPFNSSYAPGPKDFDFDV